MEERKTKHTSRLFLLNKAKQLIVATLDANLRRDSPNINVLRKMTSQACASLLSNHVVAFVREQAIEIGGT